MDTNVTYLFVAFLVTWVAISGYLFTISRQTQSLREEVEFLREERTAEKH